MNTPFSVVAQVSFMQWLDNWVLQRGQAYINNTSQFYYQPDPSLPAGYVAYAAPFKSFVWDSGVSGANILNSVSGTAGTFTRGLSGTSIDFVGGRVLLPAGVGQNAVISGSYSMKELNVYISNATQERMVFTDKPYLNPRFGNPQTGVPLPGTMVTPCIFVSETRVQNEQWAMGGLYNTKGTITLNVLAETPMQLEGVISLVTSARDVCFPQLSEAQWPLNELGDFKSGTGYNYQTLISQTPLNSLFTITDVRGSKVSDYGKIDQAVFLAVIDVTVERARTIR